MKMRSVLLLLLLFGHWNRSQQVSAVDSATKITKIAIVGERHSGTNYIQKTLQVNVKAEVSDRFCQFKHDYQDPLSKKCPNFNETLVIVMLRNPYDWALAMHEWCWCGGKSKAEKMSALSLKEYLSQPFIESSLKPWIGEKEMSGCGTLMQCRALKYLNFLNISSWAPNVVYVRHEDVITPARTEEWLWDLIARYRLPIKDTLRLVSSYKGRYNYDFDVKAAIKESTWFQSDKMLTDKAFRSQVDLITSMMDVEVERMVGYAPLRATPHDALNAALKRTLGKIGAAPT